MSVSIFVDTNVFVYSRDASQVEKQVRASEWVSHVWTAGNGRVSIQVITEYYAVVTGKLKPGMPTDQAREDVEDLFSWHPLHMTPDLIAQAWRIQDVFHLSWWDSLIVAAAKALQCSHLLSEDFQHFQDFEGIRVINPFLVRYDEI